MREAVKKTAVPLMTWYAHHLFVEASQATIERLLRDPFLASGVHRIPDVSNFPWHDPRVKHELPPDGLVVVRPICDPDSHAAEWYRQPVISWFAMQGPESANLEVNPERLQRDFPEHPPADDYPPASFLKYIKNLSAECKAGMAFYQCAMWGGETDLECAWVFGPEEIAYSATGLLEHPNKIIQYSGNGEKVEEKGYVLTKALAHLRIQLPTPFFALHTRSFPWQQYKLARKDPETNPQ